MLYGVTLLALATLGLSDDHFRTWQLFGLAWGVPAMLAMPILLTGIGLGIALPASNNACIELMPSKVATITGLRGMFRYIGGAIGISLTTLFLHASGTIAAGFRLSFIIFGILFLASVPLVFLMPTGKAAGAHL
jgi:MFS family permease